jgi:hypothetical protein
LAQALGVPFEKVVLVDHGGGTGVLGLLAKEAGVATVVYNDINRKFVETARAVGQAICVRHDHYVEGGIDRLINYMAKASLKPTVIVSYDVIEHIYDMDEFLRKVAGLSAGPFGLLMSSGANLFNPRYVFTVPPKQTKAERHWRSIRRDIIIKHAPWLDAGAIQFLTKASRGMAAEDIRALVSAYVATRQEMSTGVGSVQAAPSCHTVRRAYLEMAKILAVYYTDKPGGFCKRLYRLLAALAKRDNEVHFVCLDKPPIPDEVPITWCPIPFPLKRRVGLLFWFCFSIWCPLYLMWKTWRLRPARYVVFGAYYATLSLPARLIYETPSVLFLRSIEWKADVINARPRWLRMVKRLCEWLGIRSASKVVYVSDTMRREVKMFLGREPPRAAVPPNDVPRPHPASGSVAPRHVVRALERAKAFKFVALTVGVLERSKNVEYIVKAFGLLGNENIACLLVAGKPPVCEPYGQRLGKEGGPR